MTYMRAPDPLPPPCAPKPRRDVVPAVCAAIFLAIVALAIGIGAH